MKRLGQILVLSMFVVSLFVFPKPAHACSCYFPRTPSEGYAMVDAVFVGKVVLAGQNISLIDRLTSLAANYVPSLFSNQPSSGYYGNIYTFEVSKSWKGVERTRVAVLTNSGSTACGYPLQLGQEYLVYAYANENNDGFWTITCTRTQLLNARSEEDLQYLDTLPVLTLKEPVKFVLMTGILCMVLASGTAGIGIFLRRKRQRKNQLA